jgi:hypothetical protein
MSPGARHGAVKGENPDAGKKQMALSTYQMSIESGIAASMKSRKSTASKMPRQISPALAASDPCRALFRIHCLHLDAQKGFSSTLDSTQTSSTHTLRTQQAYLNARSNNMPRLTRAQLKAQAEGTAQIHEDNYSEHETRELTPDSDPARPVLKDITVANLAFIELDEFPEVMTQKKPKMKKGGKKNAKTQPDTPVEEVTPQVEVLEDHDQSDGSEAADTAAENLRNEAGITEPFQVTMDTARPQTPPSAAVNEAMRSLSKSPTKRTPAVAKTPKFEPTEHTTPVMADGAEHDSFVGTCKKASPFKLPLSQEPRNDGSDSFVEQIIVRSPAKPMARIEDSVEAIDALEDAIEQVAGELPSLGAEQLLSPAKKPLIEPTANRQSVKRKLAPSAAPGMTCSTKSLSSKTSSTKLSSSKSPAKEAARSPLKTGSASQKPAWGPKPTVRVSSKTMQPRPSVAAKPPTTAATKLTAAAPQISFSNSPAKPRANVAHKRAPGTIPPSVKAPFVPKPSSKPPTTSTFTLPGDAVAAKLKAEREERQKRMEAGEVAKSVKPAPVIKRTVSVERKAPTVPSYQLPGDAIAAKLKAQREARAEREASAEAGAKEKSKSFRARPVPARRPSVAPRENKASTMRMSVVQREDLKRRGSDKENVAPPVQARAPIPTQRLEVKKIRNSLSGKIPNAAVSRRSMNLSNLNVQERKAEPTVTMSRTEKEEAARKARAEAAERGRLASKEWAEKQKRKMAADKLKAKRESTIEEVVEAARAKVV